MKIKRSIRLSGSILKEISSMLLKEIKDPRIGFVTLTKAEISNDLKIAKIYCSVIGTDKEKKDSMAGLKSAGSFMRRELGKRLDIKSAPELIFKEDTSLEKASKIYKLIDELSKKEG